MTMFSILSSRGSKAWKTTMCVIFFYSFCYNVCFILPKLLFSSYIKLIIPFVLLEYYVSCLFLNSATGCFFKLKRSPIKEDLEGFSSVITNLFPCISLTNKPAFYISVRLYWSQLSRSCVSNTRISERSVGNY